MGLPKADRWRTLFRKDLAISIDPCTGLTDEVVWRFLRDHEEGGRGLLVGGKRREGKHLSSGGGGLLQGVASRVLFLPRAFIAAKKPAKKSLDENCHFGGRELISLSNATGSTAAHFKRNMAPLSRKLKKQKKIGKVLTP